ncbi:hypothetical protein CDD82_6386 [Ophiocordyceps australis]|uniref:Uncharacterized protein n=1 Tax=Ophiocordyceps australis TaxID=1399860 RepID=A0A2C5YV79_9HYPO|nr:hypothetical protein CDD82_6386 [Ophiocordyceps australis]
MGHSSQPFMYSGLDGGSGSEWRFPVAVFDPKAVTRASWQAKPAKPRARGPLISLDQHPDAHALPSYRAHRGRELSKAARNGIKWLRRVQWALRMLQLSAAAAVLALMTLLVRMDPVTVWTLRIAPGLSVLHCLYAVLHLSRSASGRTPASSAAYHAFAAAIDLGLLSAYVFGAMRLGRTLHGPVATSLSDQSLAPVFVSTVYYALIGTAGLELLSLSMSLWLGFMFRRISLLPPDMNPLERRLTTRPMHAKKLSTTTVSSSSGDEHGGDLSSCSSLPFTHARAGHDYVPYRHSASRLPTNLSNLWTAQDRYINKSSPAYTLLQQHNEQHNDGPLKTHPDPLRVHPPPAEKRDAMQSLMSTLQPKPYAWQSNVSVTDETRRLTHQKQPWRGPPVSSRGQLQGGHSPKAHGKDVDSEPSPLHHPIIGSSSRLSSGSDYRTRRSTSTFASAAAPERRRVSGKHGATEQATDQVSGPYYS